MLVQDLITRLPVVARPSAAVAQAAWLMKRREACLDTMESFGVRRLPVVDEEKALLGVVSLDDILVHLGRSFAMAGSLIRSEVAAGV